MNYDVLNSTLPLPRCKGAKGPLTALESVPSMAPTAARGSGGALKLHQRVCAEPVHQKYLVHLLLKIMSGEHLSSLSGSGRSPVTKHVF